MSEYQKQLQLDNQKEHLRVVRNNIIDANKKLEGILKETDISIKEKEKAEEKIRELINFISYGFSQAAAILSLSFMYLSNSSLV